MIYHNLDIKFRVCDEEKFPSEMARYIRIIKSYLEVSQLWKAFPE